jgi:hypothetical protein
MIAIAKRLAPQFPQRIMSQGYRRMSPKLKAGND